MIALFFIAIAAIPALICAAQDVNQIAVANYEPEFM